MTIYQDEGKAAHKLSETAWRENKDPSEYLGLQLPNEEMEHSALGASSAYRWVMCPGSVGLTKTIPHVEEPLELIEVDEEMAEAVKLLHDTVRGHADELRETPTILTEQQFSLADLKPPVEMFGTADFVEFYQRNRLLIVDDFKYGKGVLVEVVDEDGKPNMQAAYYALGALIEFERKHGRGMIDRIRLVIVQPRAYHASGPVREIEITVDDLLAFAVRLLRAAEATQEPNAPLVPGAHCRFCRAKGVCPALRDHAVQVARIEFGDAPLRIPEVKALTAPELAFILNRMDIVEGFFSGVRARVQEMLERGEDVPGFKLVPKRANRSWKDEGAAATQLTDAITNAKIELFTRELRSPAQIEGDIKRATKAKSAERLHYTQLLESLVQKVSSGNKIAPTNDPRPAALIGPPGSEFSESAPQGETA